MISYRVSEADLVARIHALKPKWRARAAAATAACATAGKYVTKNADGTDTEGLWGEIKEIFMTLQHDKCCYCERKLASATFGKVEHDVEHFRPKSRVKNWFAPAVKKELPDWPASLGKSPAQTKGYFLLPFDPRNYATACKECNSALKSDYFPCGKAPILDAPSPAHAASEEPWLIFPVGDLDESAEDLIQFEGILAQPVHDAASDPKRHWRARVTIRFFHLNVPAETGGAPASEGRENLYRERAETISDLAYALDSRERATTAARRQQDERKIRRLVAAEGTHANCARSFLKLWTEAATRAKAVTLWGNIETYLAG